MIIWKQMMNSDIKKRINSVHFKPVKMEGSADKVGVHINVTSRSNDEGRMLSPFIVGPVKVPGVGEALNLENAWQFSKVYPGHLDNNGNVSDQWLAWAYSGISSAKPVRYPMGRGTKPEFSLWDGKRLGYIEAKRSVYFPIYRDLIKSSRVFLSLQEEILKGGQITIYDFDVYPLGKERSLSDALNNPKRIFGHGFIVGAMLIYGTGVTPDVLDSMSGFEVESKKNPPKEDQMDMFGP